MAKKHPNPVLTEDPCEQCSLRHRRIRLTLSIPEAERILEALGTDSPEGEYINAQLVIARRPDHYYE